MTLSFAFRLKWVLIAVLITYSLGFVDTCNEAVCASIVSKCIIMDSCNCDLSQCSCCKDCFICLSFLYDECCSCFGLCPKRNVAYNKLSKRSHVEDLDEPNPNLYQALTDGPDLHKRWTSFTYLTDILTTTFIPKEEKNVKYYMETNDRTHNHTIKRDITAVNCTVTYMTECKSWGACRRSCHAMGATSYRWFHDGCCECIGDRCINYGVNESRCINCPKRMITEEDLLEKVEEECGDSGRENYSNFTDIHLDSLI